MLISEIIRRKRDGHSLDPQHLLQLVQGFSDGTVPDYQASAWLMATYLNGMNTEETQILTKCMKESGRVFDWRSMHSKLSGARFADKHSTGGVGDKLSMILAPLAASLGVHVPMMSGRGLGHTGGTVDKLESIPGFQMQPSETILTEALVESGFCMFSQSRDVCPADRKLYALRDVTSTVESVPLITASILSKKWAEGCENILFDVKFGSGAFMNTLDHARQLASSLVGTARSCGLGAQALLTRMDEPLGYFVGNALEIQECVWILKQIHPTKQALMLSEPVVDLSLEMAARMSVLAGVYSDLQEAKKAAHTNLNNGKAWTHFDKMARIQGAVAGWESKLPISKNQVAVIASTSGVFPRLDGRALGLLGIKLGAGRQKVDDVIDPSVGFCVLKRPGESFYEGEPVALGFLNSQEQNFEFQTAFQQVMKTSLDWQLPQDQYISSFLQETIS